MKSLLQRKYPNLVINHLIPQVWHLLKKINTQCEKEKSTYILMEKSDLYGKGACIMDGYSAGVAELTELKWCIFKEAFYAENYMSVTLTDAGKQALKAYTKNGKNDYKPTVVTTSWTRDNKLVAVNGWPVKKIKNRWTCVPPEPKKK